MAGTITQVQYPSVFNMEGNGVNYVGIKSYRNSDNKNVTNFTGAYKDDFHFQAHPQTDPYTRPLIITFAEYSNGVDLQLEYFTIDHTDASPPYAEITGRTKLVDHRTKEVIDFQAPINEDTNFSMNITLATASMSQLDYVPVRYYPSSTIYDNSEEAHQGDAAANLYAFGALIAAETPGLYPITDLSGEVEDSKLVHYARANFTNSILYSASDYDNFVDSLVEGGDGSNPVIDPVDPSDKPFENNPSRPGGGYGGYTGKGDVTGKPGLPTSGALSSGFIAMYAPSTAQLADLGAELWSDNFFDNFLKLWNDPMEAIISLNLCPFTPPAGQSVTVQVGNYTTNVLMPKVYNQYVTLSCGSVSIDEFWGNALDYGPYTEAELFLPFVGMRKLDIDDIMNKTVEVDYNIDLLGGEAIAYVTVDNRVLYDFHCNLFSSVPISSSSYASLYSGILKAASGAAIGMTAGGGIGAAAGGLTSAINVMGSKHSNIERGGELSPNAGALGLLTPYIILHRPVQSLPQNFGHFKGYPSNITRTLGSVSGYTEVSYIHLDGISATDAEKEEIYTLLKDGVIL